MQTAQGSHRSAGAEGHVTENVSLADPGFAEGWK